jgi:hypothetical protein
MTERTQEEIIASAAQYTEQFQSRLYDASAKALTGDPVSSQVLAHSLYSSIEIAQAAWAGNELGMPIEEAVGQLIWIAAIAYAETNPKPSLVQRLFRNQPAVERNHVAMVNYANEFLLNGGPDPVLAPRFARRYSELLQRVNAGPQVQT